MTWPPREGRVRGAIFQGARHLVRHEYLHASRAFARASAAAAPEEYEPVRGLLHLAAAGYRGRLGDVGAARRQLAHARRRTGREPPPLHGVDVAGLIEHVEAALAAAEHVSDQPANERRLRAAAHRQEADSLDS